jgi:hypothetical protein
MAWDHTNPLKSDGECEEFKLVVDKLQIHARVYPKYLEKLGTYRKMTFNSRVVLSFTLVALTLTATMGSIPVAEV